MKVVASVEELIGRTPLLQLNRFSQKAGIKANLIAKLEMFNPGGSAKDRIARHIIDVAEKSGKLKAGGVIIEPTSGNTGIGIASVGASKGYRVIITMPETMSVERRLLMESYGAEVILTQGALGMKGAIQKAEELAKEIPDSIIGGQFENFANPEAHRLTTGPEIWEDTDGQIDVFVAGVGTGGTISGAGEYLKAKNPNLKIIAVEPMSSAILSGKDAGVHKIQGIGAGFIPQTLNTDIYDEVIAVTNDDAIETKKALARAEGVLVGISSGAALWAAAEIGKRKEYESANIVVLFPDTGERYLSAGI